MRQVLFAIPLLASMLACSDSSSDSSTAPSTRTTDAQVETLQQRFAAGGERTTWLGKTAQGDACLAYVESRTGGGNREFDLRVSLDKENMVNGVVMPADGRPEASMFYLNTAGATDTRSFSVSEATIDVESDDHSVKEGRVSRLRAQPSAGGFAYIEVSETRNGSTGTRKCEGVTKN